MSNVDSSLASFLFNFSNRLEFLSAVLKAPEDFKSSVCKYAVAL